MYKYIFFILSLITIFSLSHCQQAETDNRQPTPPTVYTQDEFADYWYSGKAEVAAYNLSQSRYGESREGKAVLIFVTEPFSKSDHVKLDDPDASGDDKVTVLKLNFTKKFDTGIYPYSMMLSAFSPVNDHRLPLKINMSAQEWCGHVFTQMNLDNRKYNMHSYSYFQQEGDQNGKLEAKLTEDGIWNIIRLNYRSLPSGEVEIIPGLFFTRLHHKDLHPMKATASLSENGEQATYTIRYAERTLAITFATTFPFYILSWEETYISSDGKTLTTSATLDKKLHIDYWSKNKNADSYLRDSLNLDQ